MPTTAPIRVLIVDDSHCDAQLTQLWLKSCRCVATTEVVRTVGEAIARVRREPPFENLPPPQLILLDVNLPDSLGWDLLQVLRDDAALARIPVIVLTGTVQAEDMEKAEQLGAARCLCKPFDADEFASFVKEVEAVVQKKG